MSDFNFEEFDNGYSIGELDSDSYITGFGYSYWLDNDEFAIGEFNSDKKEGWILSNGDVDGNYDRMYLSRWRNDKQVDGIAMMSTDDTLWICETDKNGDYCGYQFTIWKDGSWRYEYNDEESRAILYDTDDDTLAMTYLKDGDSVWKQIIAKDKVEEFGVSFQYFEPVTYKNVKFKVGKDRVVPIGNGPGFVRDEEHNTTTIMNIENGKANGVSYFDANGHVLISQISNGKNNGGCLMVQKNTCWYKYMYINNGVQEQVEVLWFPDTCALEVRKFCYEDKNRYDLIQIDKDFNVLIVEGYSGEENNLIWKKSFDFDEVYEGKEVEEDEEEIEEKPISRKTSSKNKNSADDWIGKFKDLFK